MARPSLREQIVGSGLRTVHEVGYARAGVREITAAAGVPQGSFTNHFRSKEAFGLAILDRYLEGVEATMAGTLDDASLPPGERLRAYFACVTERLSGSLWRYGCLIGNLGLEAAEHSEALRERLGQGLAHIVARFAATIAEGQRDGQFRADIPADELASALMSAWQGAMLWMKVHRSGAAIATFRDVTLPALLLPETEAGCK